MDIKSETIFVMFYSCKTVMTEYLTRAGSCRHLKSTESLRTEFSGGDAMYERLGKKINLESYMDIST